MLPSTAFYMIRHGESEANLGEYASGHVDVALTEKGWEQARQAARIVETLEIKPTIIIHSHLQRARNTARVINEALGLAMVEDREIAEQMYGDWEGVSWTQTRQPIRDGIDPPNGETHAAFRDRVKAALSRFITDHPEPALIVCHGGIFRAFGGLYGQRIVGVRNCCLHSFTPAPEQADFPWKIKDYGNGTPV